MYIIYVYYILYIYTYTLIREWTCIINKVKFAWLADPTELSH